MGVIYKDYMFRVKTNLTECDVCKAAIRENNLAASCAVCGAYVCAACVRGGVSERHICKEIGCDIPEMSPAEKKAMVATVKRYRIYA